MQKILYNLALILLNEHAKTENIDISNTKLIKLTRQWKFQLIKIDTNKPVITLVLHKNQAHYFIHN